MSRPTRRAGWTVDNFRLHLTAPEPDLKDLAPLAQQGAEVGHLPQVLQLVRVDDRAHALDLTLRDIEDHNADQPALAVEKERTRLPVHLLTPRGDAAEQGLKPRKPRR